MSKNKKDYSDYIQHMSTLSSSLALLMGFTFTATTILLTLLPDPSLFLAQVALFLLIFMLSSVGLAMKWTIEISLSHCRNLPKIERLSVFYLLVFVSESLFGVVMLVMFLLFNLFYLTLASAVVQAIFMALSYIVLWKPIYELRKKRSSQQ